MAEELSSQADQLAQTISFFKVEGAAKGTGTGAAATGSAHRVSVAHVQAGKTPARSVKTLPPAPGANSPKQASSPKPAPTRSGATGITVKDVPDAPSLGDEDFEEF